MSYGTIETFITESVTNVDSAQKYPLGMIIRAVDPTLGMGEFIYLKGLADTAIGTVVNYDQEGVTALINANTVGPVAVAMAATVANTYGWYQITGVAKVLVDTDVADNAAVYASGAGTVNDAAVAGDQVWPAKFVAARTGAGLVSCSISRPSITNDVDDATT